MFARSRVMRLTKSKKNQAHWARSYEAGRCWAASVQGGSQGRARRAHKLEERLW